MQQYYLVSIMLILRVYYKTNLLTIRAKLRRRACDELYSEKSLKEICVTPVVAIIYYLAC
jgi:hypothetical protein